MYQNFQNKNYLKHKLIEKSKQSHLKLIENF
jgi:hypothetical protein